MGQTPPKTKPDLKRFAFNPEHQIKIIRTKRFNAASQFIFPQILLPEAARDGGPADDKT